MKNPRIPPQLRAALEATGLPWSIENGGRHLKVRLDGHMATILPKGRTSFENASRAVLNSIAQVRRLSRQREDGVK